jgi:hypothetical protein
LTQTFLLTVFSARFKSIFVIFVSIFGNFFMEVKFNWFTLSLFFAVYIFVFGLWFWNFLGKLDVFFKEYNSFAHVEQMFLLIIQYILMLKKTTVARFKQMLYLELVNMHVIVQLLLMLSKCTYFHRCLFIFLLRYKSCSNRANSVNFSEFVIKLCF